MPWTSARPCALSLSIIALTSSLKFTRVGCRPSFFISSIDARNFHDFPALEVGFDQGVERDDVDHARLPRLVHDVFGRLQVLAIDAHVEPSVVDEVV